MCCISIGYCDFLLPVDVGTKVIALMQDAVPCETKYAGGKTYHVGREQMEISMSIVKPSQVQPATGVAESSLLLNDY